jgi:O-succinylbenzoate synthase
VDAVELRRVRLPLVAPFRTAHGTVASREVLLVRVGEGWGECAALPSPTYTSEYVDGAHAVLRDELVPRFFAGGLEALAEVRGHRMAKAALEMAVLDDRLRREGTSLASFVGATRTHVPAGIALGLAGSTGALLDEVEAAVAEGYQRVKLKIQPGWDVDPVGAVRERFGDGLSLAVDANGSYSVADIEDLCRLDQFALLFVEQPFPPDDLLSHVALGRAGSTPVCLDESIVSARSAEAALALGACRVVNVKPGRVGGLIEAGRVIDVATDAWIGGMLETGLGRAALVALAARPDVTMVGDLSASARWYTVDITEPFVIEDGTLRVPDGPGLGVNVLPDVLDAHTTSVEVVKRT